MIRQGVGLCFARTPGSGRRLAVGRLQQCDFSSAAPSPPSHFSSVIPPARIILVRHGESMGNISEETYATTPDWKINLTESGLEQARQAGRDLISMLIQKDRDSNDLQQPQSLLTYCSPYERTLQTWSEMQKELLLSKHKLDLVGTRQEPRLAEQQFGNFQNPSKVLTAKEERIDFGRFFYRFPNGESGLDVYSRVTSFMGSLSRDLHHLGGYQNLNVLCVTHGLTLRLFIMRYFQLTVHEFEETFNPPNAKLILMQREFSKPKRTYYYRLAEESKQILNFRGDVSTELPVFWRNRDNDTDPLQ